MDINSIKWGAFKETLSSNPQANLQFQYAEDMWVAASYHITEVKQAPITSVDCGGAVDSWTEVIVQLYEPAGGQQAKAMKVEKALSIIKVVESKLPLDTGAMVKIEFGNAGFATRQMLPNHITLLGEDLVIDMRPDSVQCKAIERGGSCGTPSEQKTQVKLTNLAVAAACCVPGGGCC